MKLDEKFQLWRVRGTPRQSHWSEAPLNALQASRPKTSSADGVCRAWWCQGALERFSALVFDPKSLKPP